ncbi:aminoacyl-tRNA hydrolase [Saxibacter everestensis]|uniref:Peptidyl-tRNA hydrolase n=1 Tax=Saxibacter everestensis TaxID=2909229 RepID=A0ABY8QP91_9MICO|nr:aminoacyl-tRNA hydrolase [Brevibacteriaceae bacterium ZFBP1038]
MNDSWLIVGLGNPGPDYSATRHNVGQMVLDELSRRIGAGFRSHKARAQVAEGRLGVGPGGVPGPKVILAKPSTFMNVSGGPVAALAKFFSKDPAQLIVVHDELDIPFDQIKLKTGGGDGGHNGLKDITNALGTKDYLRVRVGIGRPPGRMDAATYVLKPFSGTERTELPMLLVDAADAVELLVSDGLVAAQQKFHGRTAG